MSKYEFTPYGTNPEMDKLVDSECIDDRINAVYKEYGLDKLVNDKCWEVREAVAILGNIEFMKQLINDEEPAVIGSLCCNEYGLDEFVTYDKDWDIYGVLGSDWLTDQLKDGDTIKDLCQLVLKTGNYKDINDWIAKNPDKCALPENQRKSNKKVGKDKVKASIQPDKSINLGCKDKGER